jgi:ferritin-like metal-binding protein YciE
MTLQPYEDDPTMSQLNTLANLFDDELRDTYDAEHQIVKALPDLINAVSNDQLREALQSHLEETRGQVKRLQRVFQSRGIKAQGKHCDGMEGILKEGAALIQEDGEDAVRNAVFIASAQRVEHYEIAAYGTLIAWAEILGYDEAATLLTNNLAEEEAADASLSELAEVTNKEAIAASENAGASKTAAKNRGTA